ncbi:unnamed protein product [Orchesella dallaii]|uniref:Uncharacterized protein n=1 Tax=Orchesella dallaii TaxID=48710 RepID=A0ABP1SAQ0_9HEXA
MLSPSSGSEQSFSVAGGEFTDAERRYLIRKGLAWEDSQGELFDVSTDIDDANSSKASHDSSLNTSNVNDQSLLLFEENEKLLQSPNGSFMKTNDRSPSLKPRPMTLVHMNMNASDVSVSSSQMEFDEEDEDKENMCHDQSASSSMTEDDSSPTSKVNGSFAKVLSEKKLDFDEYVRLVYQTDQIRTEIEKSVRDADELGEENESMREAEDLREEQKLVADPEELGEKHNFVYDPDVMDEDEDCVLVPCTQDVMDNSSASTASGASADLEGLDIIPSTQYVSHNESALIDSDGNDDSIGIVPCTQNQEESYQSVADISSVPCSQGSVGGGDSKTDLDDTITMMTKLLALADEQEAQEKLAAEATLGDGHSRVVEVSASDDELNCSKTSEIVSDDSVAAQTEETAGNSEEFLFKTPLKHTRVQLLKNRKVCTPSPPRSYVNQLLQRGAANKTAVISGDPVKLNKNSNITPAKPKPFISTSTPNRTPLTNITPAKKTPGLINGKTPVSAKIDTGLRRSPGFLAIGLSPVADYIHSKPPPSTFARAQGIHKQTPLLIKATSKTSLPRPNNSFTKIPAPPRLSQAQSQIKVGNERNQMRHSVLKSETYFDLNATPPRIVSNIKRFAPTEYKGPAKVKTTDGKVDSSPKKDFVAHRHTGIRDVSGNASFIQNAAIQKRFIPAQSRLATPPSYTRK